MFKILRFRISDIYTSIVHGKYSLKYVNLFKRNNLRSPFTPCIKDEFIFHVLMFIIKSPKAETFSTSNKIQFGNIPFSTTYKEVFFNKGIPYCFNAMMVGSHEIKVVGYQELVNKTRFKSVYFFINDKFCVGEYLFSDVGKVESLDISKILMKKYISDSIDEKEELYIEDGNGNIIYYRDNGFETSIKYCNFGNKDVKQIIFDLGKYMIPVEENNDNLEKVITKML